MTNKNWSHHLIAGGIAGISDALVCHPLDTIKTRIQNESCKTIKEAISKGSLFKGLQICLIRSILANGVNFYSYEKMNDILMKK